MRSEDVAALESVEIADYFDPTAYAASCVC